MSAQQTGAIAEATPGMDVPQEWADRVFGMLDAELQEYFVKFYDFINVKL